MAVEGDAPVQMAAYKSFESFGHSMSIWKRAWKLDGQILWFTSSLHFSGIVVFWNYKMILIFLPCKKTLVLIFSTTVFHAVAAEQDALVQMRVYKFFQPWSFCQFGQELGYFRWHLKGLWVEWAQNRHTLVHTTWPSLARVNHHPPTNAPRWMDGVCTGHFLSLGSCSPANLPIARGSKIQVPLTGCCQNGKMGVVHLWVLGRWVTPAALVWGTSNLAKVSTPPIHLKSLNVLPRACLQFLALHSIRFGRWGDR